MKDVELEEPTPCVYDHQFKEEEMGSVGELSKFCSQIVLKCSYLARTGRPDILWSVNCLQIHLPHATSSHAQSFHSTNNMWLKAQVVFFELRSQNTHFIHASWLTLCCTRHRAPTSPVLFSYTSPTPCLLSTHPLIHCEDPRQDGTSSEYQPLKGYEPKRIELNRTLFNLCNQEIDDQDDIEEIGVKPMSYSQSLIHSAYGSAESIATPPDSITKDAGFTTVYRSIGET